MLENSSSTSLELGSTPNFLASLTLTLSLISSSITSCRVDCLWVVRKFSLVRCSISKLVMGSPLTITATVCADSGEAPEVSSPSTIAQPAISDRRR